MFVDMVVRVFGLMAVVGFLVCVLVIPERMYRRATAQRRALARAQLRNCCVESPDPRYSFDGRTATIVEETESTGGRRGVDQFSITTYATNEAGEYFMLIADGVKKPFFKHVEHRLARLVLKGKYSEPRVG